MRTSETSAANRFYDVARIIAKGNPPEWLPIALGHFSPGIGEDLGDYNWLIEKTVHAIDDLLFVLPVFEHLGFGFAGEHKDARTVLALLPGIKKDFERGLRQGTGRKPDTVRAHCAAVMIEAWKQSHDGRVEPHSKEFRQACGEYWIACGGKKIGAKQGNWLANWRRPIEDAVAMDQKYIRKIISAIVRNTT
jgi:hypothetical protein